MSSVIGSFSSRDSANPALGQPYWGNAIQMELGYTYIAWLFGGFNTDLIRLDPDPKFKQNKDPDMLKHGYYWVKIPQRGDSRMPHMTNTQ
jgi:hypothetical protein